MDFSNPFRVVTPTLDGPVLHALSGSDAALTRAQIHRLSKSGSDAGVRKVLKRLVGQGIVVEEHVGSRFTYRANREHLLWPAVEAFASAHELLDERIQTEVATWSIPPMSVELFGSVATGRSTGESDVDLMIVSPHLTVDDEDAWDAQVDSLRDAVLRWTGNVCEILVMDPPQLVEAKANDEPSIRSERVSLAGDRIDAMVPSPDIARLFAQMVETKRQTKSLTEALEKTPEMKRLREQMQQVRSAVMHGKKR